MIRFPLNIIPTYIIQVLQVCTDVLCLFANQLYTHAFQLLYHQKARVALDRISVYLDEDEVSEQVSSLKKVASPPATASNGNQAEDGLGFVDASFRWNEVPDSDEGKDVINGKGKGSEPSSGSTVVSAGNENDETASTAASEVSEAAIDFTAPDAGEDRRFELKDLNLRFPEGELTIITGPTASGKTALLVR
jgi:ABC-type multidrug transport system fused ATPase/permease subunit